MLRIKITETISTRSNEDLPDWYHGKITELAKFFVKRVHTDSRFIKNTAKCTELETITK